MSLLQIKKDVLALREKWRTRPDYNCFWSGPDNARGLRLTPTVEPGRVFVDVKIETFHSGFPGIANGGVSFTILDGMMSWYLMSHLGRGGFTKTAQTSYFAPLHVGRTYRFEVTAPADQTATSGGSFKLSGQVFLIKDHDQTVSKKPMLTMEADFFLPDRATAKQVLQVELGEAGEEIFPESEV